MSSSLYRVVSSSGKGNNLKYHFDPFGRGQVETVGFEVRGSTAPIYPFVVGVLDTTDIFDVCTDFSEVFQM
jgi:hypothetical protein